MDVSLSSVLMAKMNIVLTDEKEKQFREAVFRAKGMKKGNISEAIDEAIDLWIDRMEKKEASK